LSEAGGRRRAAGGGGPMQTSGMRARVAPSPSAAARCRRASPHVGRVGRVGMGTTPSKAQGFGDARPPSATPGGLRLFLDSARVEDHRVWMPTGIFHGVTMSPHRLEEANVACSVANLRDMVSKCIDMGAQEVHVPTWGLDYEVMQEVGMRLTQGEMYREKVVVKVPVTIEGVRAAGWLTDQGVRVALVSVYSAHQAVTCVAAGAEYCVTCATSENALTAALISDLAFSNQDISAQMDSLTAHAGRETVEEMSTIMNALDSSCRVMVASIRGVGDIAFLSARGVNTFALKPEVCEMLFSDSLTSEAALKFQFACADQGAISNLEEIM